MYKSRLHKCWRAMKERVLNHKCKKYYRYGGRGIKICDEWLEFIPFMKWSLMNGYADNLVIDRINNEGNYEPNNCRWITLSENSKNRTKGDEYGIYPNGKNFMVRITENSKLTYKGTYSTIDEAKSVRDKFLTL